jgi:hypothetical protein
MTKRYTVNVQMFEVVDEPQKMDRYGKVESAKVRETNKAGDFTVRADTYEGAVQKAIAHLQLELPGPLMLTDPRNMVPRAASQFPGPRGEGELGNR